ncbi:hypothetical protein [Inconstantimicrobium porci]|uniref:hypothetical protein n=1 Tax=Inconstantimicrobium porci TaxID=2652291 RepID=UPI00240A334C|nr:hypothetical protein [Inconstantimicrobium porci]MDD6769682.1 hypothetical protein [Inconstantimicrobium porci]
MPKIDLLDPKIYIPNFLKIRTKEGEIKNFIPNAPQKRLRDTIARLREAGKPVRIIILKARQMGFSTYTEADCFHQTATHKNFNSMIIAHEDPASQNLYDMFKRYYENLPPAITPMRKRNNSKELLFENPTMDDLEKRRNPGLQSRVKVSTAKNTATGRSQTINYLHASEVAFWDNPKETFTGLLQCIPRTANSTVIMESTANGVGDYFYDMWNNAVQGKNDFVPLFFAWFEMKEYSIPFDTEEDKKEFMAKVNYVYKDSEGNEVHTEEWHLMQDHHVTYEQLNWRRWCIQNNCGNDIDQFHQEYPSTPEEAFIASGRPVFLMSALKQYLRVAKQGEIGDLVYQNDKVVFVPNPNGVYEIWKKPEEGNYYCIGADVAEGTIDGDYSVAYVGDTQYDICCRYRTHIDPDLYADELVKLAKYYNEAYLAVENNNHGHAVIRKIQALEYYNLFFTKSYDKINDTVQQKVGWTTTAKTKPMMIDKMKEFIRNMWLGIKDKVLLKECITYIICDDGSFNAQEGCHDDCVMATGILLQALLEGKSDSYVPYIPHSEISNESNEKFAQSKLFDEDNDDEENKLEIAD